MGTDTKGALLDPRLRFPIRALADERVVWAGTAAPSAFRAALWRTASVFGAMLLFFALLLSMPPALALVDQDCSRAVDPDAKPIVERPCTVAERADARERIWSAIRWIATVASAAWLLTLVLRAIASALSRRKLVYVVTNERVIVQYGTTGLRIDTIDLDHVVSVSAEADWIDRWFGLKSISLIVPGQRYSYWNRQPLANAVALWGIDAQDPALSQLLNVWLPRQRR